MKITKNELMIMIKESVRVNLSELTAKTVRAAQKNRENNPKTDKPKGDREKFFSYVNPDLVKQANALGARNLSSFKNYVGDVESDKFQKTVRKNIEIDFLVFGFTIGDVNLRNDKFLRFTIDLTKIEGSQTNKVFVSDNVTNITYEQKQNLSKVFGLIEQDYNVKIDKKNILTEEKYLNTFYKQQTPIKDFFLSALGKYNSMFGGEKFEKKEVYSKKEKRDISK